MQLNKSQYTEFLIVLNVLHVDLLSPLNLVMALHLMLACC